jgi:hypothetical protein
MMTSQRQSLPQRATFDSYVKLQRRMRAAALLPLHLIDARVTLDRSASVLEADLEFCGPDPQDHAVDAWAKHASAALARIDGSLRIRRDNPSYTAAMLTLDPVTDLVHGRLQVSADALRGACPPAPSSAVVLLRVDLTFSPAAWRIPVPAHTHAELRLRGPAWIEPDRAATS